MESHSILEAAANAAQHGGLYETNVLLEHVLNFPHALCLPMSLRQAIHAELTRAEHGFWQHSHQGVPEEDIVRIVNLACDRLRMPDFAKTNRAQVRELRMNLLVHSPVFMGRGMIGHSVSVGDSISPVLSPFQAVHLIESLIDQKFLDPAYQVTPDEWLQKSKSQRLSERQVFFGAPSAQRDAVLRSRVARRKELQSRLDISLKEMSYLDDVDLLNEAMKNFGIN